MRRGHVSLNTPFIERRLLELRLTQDEVARRAGIARRTLIRWLDGTTRFIRETSARKLATALECELSDLTVEQTDVGAKSLWVGERTFEELSRIVDDEDFFKVLVREHKMDIYFILARAVDQKIISQPQFGRLLCRAAAAKWTRYEFKDALHLAERALEIGESQNDQQLIALAQAQRAKIFATAGKFLEAKAAYSEVKLRRSHLGVEFDAIEAAILCFISSSEGNFEEALTYSLKEESLQRGTDEHGFACISAAQSCLNLDRLDDALVYLEKAIKAADRCGSDIMKTLALISKALALFDLGLRAESLAAFLEAESQPSARRCMNFFAVGATICAANERPGKAQALLNEAYRVFGGNPLTAIYLDRRKAEVMWYSGQKNEALETLHRVELQYDRKGSCGKRDSVRKQLADWYSELETAQR